MNESVRRPQTRDERKGEENIRAALVKMTIKPAYIEKFVTDVQTMAELADFATMDANAILSDYQLFVELGGLNE